MPSSPLHNLCVERIITEPEVAPAAHELWLCLVPWICTFPDVYGVYQLGETSLTYVLLYTLPHNAEYASGMSGSHDGTGRVWVDLHGCGRSWVTMGVALWCWWEVNGVVDFRYEINGVVSFFFRVEMRRIGGWNRGWGWIWIGNWIWIEWVWWCVKCLY